MLWVVVIGLLAVIARYAYIAAQPDRRCYSFLDHKIGCDRAEDYSDSDRAKLESVVEKAIPAQYVKRRMP
jgi:hypothetical protein